MSGFQFQSGPMYDPTSVQPMRAELTAVGVKELLTPEDVDAAIGQKGTLLLVVNSVCGCAAGNARPGVMLALQNRVIPDQLTTVFAGQDRAATAHARGRMSQYPPSSPCIALFKDGEVVCQVLADGCFDGLDLVVVDVDDPLALEWAQRAVESGARVVDNSAAFRTDPDVNDANDTGNIDLLGWTSRRGHEIGDQPIFQAGFALNLVFKEVTPSSGSGSKIPVQFMYSNVVHGAEGPIVKPH